MSNLWRYLLSVGGVFYTLPSLAAEDGATIPHMDVTSYASQIFWLVVCFALLYWMMARAALPRIEHILDQRVNTVQKNLEKAAKLRDQAEDIQIAYDKALRQANNHAQEFLANSINDIAEKNAQELSKTIDKVLEKIQKAEIRISNQRNDAMKKAEKTADEIATVLTKKILHMQKNSTVQTKKELN